MARVAQQLIDDGCRLDLCVQVDMRGKRGHDDMAVAEKVRALLRSPSAVEVVSAGATPAEAIAHYGEYDIVIGSRLHSALIGLCAATPAIAIAYQPKASSIYNDMGLSDWVLEARGLDPTALQRVASTIIEDPKGSAERASKAASEMKAELHRCLSGSLESWLGPRTRRLQG